MAKLTGQRVALVSLCALFGVAELRCAEGDQGGEEEARADAAAAEPAADLTGAPGGASPGKLAYRLTETVQVRVINGVPEPQFRLGDVGPAGFSIGDSVNAMADVSGVDDRGDPVTGAMLISCVATGVEERNPPLCTAPRPDGTCGFLETRSPFFLCTQVFRLNDPAKGVDGTSQLTFQGFVRQIEAQGNPPGQNTKPQWLAITGGTGRFARARGQVKYELFEAQVPPPLKRLEVYIKP